MKWRFHGVTDNEKLCTQAPFRPIGNSWIFSPSEIHVYIGTETDMSLSSQMDWIFSHSQIHDICLRSHLQIVCVCVCVCVCDYLL
jgi:hypothetical protein